MELNVFYFVRIGMYKYISNVDSQSIFNAHQYQPYGVDDEISKFKKLHTDCNPYNSIVRKDDGGILDGWKLQGVLMLSRHGKHGVHLVEILLFQSNK